MPDDTADAYTISTIDNANTSSGEIVIETRTAQEVFEQLYQQANQRAAAGQGVSEKERLTLEKAWQDYRQSLATQPPPQPPPKPRPAPAVAATSSALLGAPDVPTNTFVEARPSTTTVPASTPSAAAVRQTDPLPPEVVLDLITPPPADADRAAVLGRIERHEPEPGQPHPTLSDPVVRAPTQAGDPVELFTGALVMSVSDLVVPTAVMPIVMQRSYRSGPGYYGPFGRGWDHAYDVYLRPLDDGSLAFWTGQLQELTFRPAATGGWDPDPGIAARMEAVPGAGDQFEVVFPGGVRWRFKRPASWGNAQRIPLTTITDRHGNAVRLAYDTSDRVASVLDEAGRGLLFGYGQCGLLEQASDHSGTRVVRYEHDDQVAHLERVVLPATAAFPDGMPTAYEYDRDASHPAMRENIMRITDAHGRTYLENEYAGPEAGWAFNSVTRQIAGDFEYLFEYVQLQYVPRDVIYLEVPATRTCVQMPDGAVHVHTFNYRGDLLDHRFRLNRDGTYRVVASGFTYDAQGNVTEAVGPDGVRHLMFYDATNPDPCARRNLLRTDVAGPLVGVAPARHSSGRSTNRSISCRSARRMNPAKSPDTSMTSTTAFLPPRAARPASSGRRSHWPTEPYNTASRASNTTRVAN